jgi:hypothetical protein
MAEKRANDAPHILPLEISKLFLMPDSKFPMEYLNIEPSWNQFESRDVSRGESNNGSLNFHTGQGLCTPVGFSQFSDSQEKAIIVRWLRNSSAYCQLWKQKTRECSPFANLLWVIEEDDHVSTI